jgi:prepilin-type N-terminal cleavage/methylation domain-containing protein
MRRHDSTRHDESGVSLVEVLATVAIMGIVMGALGAALFTGMRTTRDTTTSLGQSNSELLVSTWLTKDVQRADTVRTNVTSTCGNAPAVLETTTRTDPVATTSNVTVAYRLTGGSLARQECGATPSTITIARKVTAFTATGSDPVQVGVTSAAGDGVKPYSWTLEVRRRQS